MELQPEADFSMFDDIDLKRQWLIWQNPSVRSTEDGEATYRDLLQEFEKRGLQTPKMPERGNPLGLLREMQQEDKKSV